MKSNNAVKYFLQVIALIFAFLSLLIISNIPSFAAGNMTYLPLISRILPGGPGINSPILITEVLYNPPGIEPGGEWIELYNRSTEIISLKAYKIGDSETQGDDEGMYLFPKTASIPPGGVTVIAYQALNFSNEQGFLPDFELTDSSSSVPDMTKYRNWAGGVVNLSNSGDEILLVDRNDSILDSLSWGNSSFVFSDPIPLVADGHSIERIPANIDHNHSGDWWDQSNPQPGVVDLLPPKPFETGTPTPGEKHCDNDSLLITELLYDPAGVGEPSGEWFEIFNNGDLPVNLDCFKIGDEENRGGGEGMYIFPEGFMLEAGGVRVIANRGDTFFSVYNFNPQFELNDSVAEIPDMFRYRSWATGVTNLNKIGDELLILGVGDELIDAVSWGSSTTAFNPSVPEVKEGSSLERRPAHIDTDSAGDWTEQADPDPGMVDLTEPTVQPSPTDTPEPPPLETPDFVINEIHAKPHSDLGDANQDGDVDASDDEFIELVNNSTSNIDISGWSIKDSLELRHVFPPGSEVVSGCGIIIFGGGNPSGNFGNCVVQVASSGTLGLNNIGDTIFLLDGDLNLISTYTYGDEGSYDQSITRAPDIIGDPPLVKHSTAPGSGGALFSPGTRIDGGLFLGCSE